MTDNPSSNRRMDIPGHGEQVTLPIITFTIILLRRIYGTLGHFLMQTYVCHHLLKNDFKEVVRNSYLSCEVASQLLLMACLLIYQYAIYANTLSTEINTCVISWCEMYLQQTTDNPPCVGVLPWVSFFYHVRIIYIFWSPRPSNHKTKRRIPPL